MSTWYLDEVDPEHIWFRGFEVVIEDAGLRVADEDASEPPPVVARAAWGAATRTDREHWPYDFRPLLLSGTQLTRGRVVPYPPSFFQPGITQVNRVGRAAFVAPAEDRADTDGMEFVFADADEDTRTLPAIVLVAQLVFDTRPLSDDSFVVTATRLLEPLIAQVHDALDRTKLETEEFRALRHEAQQLADAVRNSGNSTRLKVIIGAGLGALGTIVLNIISNRLDRALDDVDWQALWNAIREVTWRLGLPH